MVSTSMVYGCTIDVFNTEDISAECSKGVSMVEDVLKTKSSTGPVLPLQGGFDSLIAHFI